MAGPAARPFRIVDLALFLVGVAGMAAGVTLMFLGMRAVLDIGGSCAEGGPYLSARPCPDGATPALLVGIFGGLASTGLVAWKGSSLAGSFGSVAALGWPALFGSLGWNFLEYGLGLHTYADGTKPGGDVGLLVCGVLFEAMAIVPLAAVIAGLRAGRVETRRPNQLAGAAQPRAAGSAGAGLADRGPATSAGARPDLGELDRALRSSLAARIADTALDDATDGTPASRPDASETLVTGLERLAALHESGEISDSEFAAAKARLLATPGR